MTDETKSNGVGYAPDDNPTPVTIDRSGGARAHIFVDTTPNDAYFAEKAIREASKAVGDASDKQTQEAISKSVVVDLPPYWFSRMWGVGGYEFSVPGVEQPARQAYLARLRYHPQNVVFQAAAYALISQFVSTSYELSGKRRISHFEDVLMNADRGLGWESFWEKVLWDFLTLDDGAVIEIIGGGSTEGYLSRELVTGIGYLDPMRCYFTGNFEYPVWYQDYYGKLHKMHYTRVIRMVDMPQGAQTAYGRGFCALSRVLASAQQTITMMTYTGEMLANEPPPGLMSVGNVLDPVKFEQSYDLYQAQRRQAGNSTYKPVWKHINPGGKEIGKAEIEFIRFAQAPEGYDFEKYIRLQAQLVASGIGMDPNDILPLVSGNLGTGKESAILDRKAHGKMIAVIFKMVTRLLNRRVLPENLEYKSKHEDGEQSREEVERANGQLDIATKMQAIGIASEAIHLYVANTVPAFRDVLLDESGELRVYDSDPKAQEQQLSPDVEAEETADDVQSEVDAGNPKTEIVTDGEKARKAIREYADTAWLSGRKDYEDVLTAFSADMYSAIEGANDGDYDRRRAGIVIRANISKYGTRGYMEGLKVGGFDEGYLDTYDQKRVNTLITEASGYVSNLTERIYSKGMSEAEIRNSVTAWGNKTLYKFFLWGLESADKNTLMVFGGRDGKESCDTCKRLKGKIYRMYEWAAAKLRPRVDTENFDCGGWECEHDLERAKKGSRRSSGKLKILAAELIHAHAA